ncbi:hypothetical protein D9615_010440 [Tricholomella constricta]|uniref:Uncharacterized protein n=1 Tax=Tricholomella constricta TaxID=117010 RepID=A0A8H5GQC1_9AGAR|nr:hypothetical protein D9615_010440 [Tricholomella constricta]
MEMIAIELEEILEQVSVVQGREWRCHNAALELLVHEGVFDPLPRQPQDIWYTTMKFADDNPIDSSNGLVPTCATDGTHIKSAFDGL